jgi:DNA (cytosine-5)-methyltransferase 1
VAVPPADRPLLRVASLCTGGGGLDLSLHLALHADVRTVVAVEGEAYAAACLVARMEEGRLAPAPVWSDLRTFDARPWRGAVDLVVGGYPCQPFSSAGLRRGADDPRHLWPHVLRVVEECGAWGLFVENVGGHLRRGFDEVVGDLDRAGFRVAVVLAQAADVGAPHQRERLFCLALRVADGYDERLALLRVADPDGFERDTRDGPRACAAPADSSSDTCGVLAEDAPPLSGSADPGDVDGPDARRAAGLPDADGLDVRVEPERGLGTTRAEDEGHAEPHDGSIPWPAPFPPRPTDLAGWRTYLDAFPFAAPAIERRVRGDADGLAGGVDAPLGVDDDT